MAMGPPLRTFLCDGKGSVGRTDVAEQRCRPWRSWSGRRSTRCSRISPAAALPTPESTRMTRAGVAIPATTGTATTPGGRTPRPIDPPSTTRTASAASSTTPSSTRTGRLSSFQEPLRRVFQASQRMLDYVLWFGVLSEARSTTPSSSFLPDSFLPRCLNS